MISKILVEINREEAEQSNELLTKTAKQISPLTWNRRMLKA